MRRLRNREVIVHTDQNKDWNGFLTEDCKLHIYGERIYIEDGISGFEVDKFYKPISLEGRYTEPDHTTLLEYKDWYMKHPELLSLMNGDKTEVLKSFAVINNQIIVTTRNQNVKITNSKPYIKYTYILTEVKNV